MGDSSYGGHEVESRHLLSFFPFDRQGHVLCCTFFHLYLFSGKTCMIRLVCSSQRWAWIGLIRDTRELLCEVRLYVLQLVRLVHFPGFSELGVGAFLAQAREDSVDRI